MQLEVRSLRGGAKLDSYHMWEISKLRAPDVSLRNYF